MTTRQSTDRTTTEKDSQAMTIGLCTIVAVAEMEVITYAFATYETALAQALENCKGVEGRIERYPERSNPHNGMRETVFKFPDPVGAGARG
jgi:hypothetical protein